MRDFRLSVVRKKSNCAEECILQVEVNPSFNSNIVDLIALALGSDRAESNMCRFVRFSCEMSCLSVTLINYSNLLYNHHGHPKGVQNENANKTCCKRNAKHKGYCS